MTREKEIKNKSKINTLPNELLEKIFVYVSNKYLLRLVCKSWYNLTGGAIHRYTFYEDSVLDFGKDLQNHPGLQCIVESLKVKKHRYHTMGSSKLFMKHIFSFCPNLIELHLDINAANNTYTRKLCKIYKEIFSSSSSSTVITIPRLKDFGVNFYLTRDNQDYVNLINYLGKDSVMCLGWRLDSFNLEYPVLLHDLITSMDTLKSIRLEFKKNAFFFNDVLEGDAIPFLTTHHTALRMIDITGPINYQFTQEALENLSNKASVNHTLKVLVMEVTCMDIWCLEYIVTKFPNIQHLEIQATIVLTVTSSKSVLKETAENMIQEFCAYCQKIKGSVKVDFVCEGSKKERVQISHD